jgi:hypothetical protein
MAGLVLIGEKSGDVKELTDALAVMAGLVPALHVGAQFALAR